MHMYVDSVCSELQRAHELEQHQARPPFGGFDWKKPQRVLSHVIPSMVLNFQDQRAYLANCSFTDWCILMR